jgi:glycosyltransferase involved in cell wall biosynthesis
MRVMLVSHRFPPDGIAGVERITQALASDLARRGDDVSIFTREPDDDRERPMLTRERLTSGGTVFRVVGGAEVRLDRFLAGASDLERLFAMALVETMPDVVHVMHLLGLSPMLTEIARRLGIPTIVSLQDFYFSCPLLLLRKRGGEPCCGPDGGRECARTCFAGEGDRAVIRWGLRASFFRRVLASANRVICPSRYMLESFEQFGLDPARARVIDNGVTLEPIDAQPRPRGDGSLKLAFLGSVVRHKGVHVILDALRIARIESVDLRIIGALPDAGYARELREKAKTIEGLRLRMYGAYEPRELPLVLDDVDLTITPSLWPEAFAIVVREALVRGIPVAVARRGGLPEAVVEAKNGFTFDPDRPAELAQILRRLVDEPQLLERLRQGARASGPMTASQHADAVRSVYIEAIEDSEARTQCPGDAEEIATLHSALLNCGFGDPEPAEVQHV